MGIRAAAIASNSPQGFYKLPHSFGAVVDHEIVLRVIWRSLLSSLLTRIFCHDHCWKEDDAFPCAVAATRAFDVSTLRCMHVVGYLLTEGALPWTPRLPDTGVWFRECVLEFLRPVYT